MPDRFCRYCQEIVTEGHTHKQPEQYYGYKWRKVRLIKLAMNPCCEICEREGRTRAATVVHHKVKVRDDRTHIYDLEIMESLCVSCHNKLSAEGYTNSDCNFPTHLDQSSLPPRPLHKLLGVLCNQFQDCP